MATEVTRYTDVNGNLFSTAEDADASTAKIGVKNYLATLEDVTGLASCDLDSLAADLTRDYAMTPKTTP